MGIRPAIVVLSIFSLGVLGGCAAKTRVDDMPPLPTDSVSVTTSTTETPPPDERITSSLRPENDCFDPIEVVPGESSKEQVSNLWGEPSQTSEWGQNTSWFYNVPDQPQGISVVFAGDIVAEIWLPVSDCIVSDMMAMLGPPEIVEVILQGDAPGPPVFPTKNFHYPRQGVTFVASCLTGTLETCTSHSPGDELETRRLYSPTTVEAIVSEAYTPTSTFVEWTGFKE